MRCRDEVPLVKGMLDNNDSVAVIGVGIQDKSENIKAFAEELEMTWPVVFDEGNVISKAYGITYGAGMVFVDSNGIVKKRYVNAVESKEFSDALSLIIN